MPNPPSICALAPGAVDLVVRYVTRATERFDLRNRLYQSLIELLRTPAKSEV
jgi:hypothetical protein